MRTRRLVKSFEWRDQDRNEVTLGPNTRIDPKTNTAKLIADSATGEFPTTADLFVASRVTEPLALRRWIGFEAVVRNEFDSLGVATTGAQFRLTDGTDERYWDGAAWAVATPSDWNTEQEIADNIDAWDVAVLGQRLGVIVNLFTNDEDATPELVRVKVLMECVIEFQEDMIYRSFVPLLRSSIRPIGRHVFPMPATGTTFTRAQLGLEAGYNVVDIDSVHDFDAMSAAEQELAIRGFIGAAPDLFNAYDPGTETVTLTGPITLGTRLLVRFIYAPEVAVNTSQDYVEQGRIPALVIDDIELIDTVEAPAGDDHVANRGAGTAVIVPSPEQGHLQMTLIGMADKQVDAHRFSEEINRFFANTPFVVSTGIDEPYRLWLIDEYAEIGEPGQNEIHQGKAMLRILHFRRWLKDSFDDFIVSNIATTISKTTSC